MTDTTEGLIEHKILADIMVIRGAKVILDSDLANLYGVETRRLNEQVRRNRDKFPEDFMFQLSKEEFEILNRKLRHQAQTGVGEELSHLLSRNMAHYKRPMFYIQNKPTG